LLQNKSQLPVANHLGDIILAVSETKKLVYHVHSLQVTYRTYVDSGVRALSSASTIDNKTETVAVKVPVTVAVTTVVPLFVTFGCKSTCQRSDDWQGADEGPRKQRVKSGSDRKLHFIIHFTKRTVPHRKAK